MKKYLLTLTISSFFAVGANASVSGCPSGWIKSGDGKECVLTEKVDTPALGTSDTTRPICINGFTYESATNKCSKTVNANTTAVNKINVYQGPLVFGTVRNPVPGQCGSAIYKETYLTPTVNLCSVGASSNAYPSGNNWVWTCKSQDTSDTTCYAPKSNIPGTGCSCPSFTAYNDVTKRCWGSYFIYQAYINLFDRVPEPAGYAYWYRDLNGRSRYIAGRTIYSGAQNNDITVSRNKMTNVTGVSAIYSLMFNRGLDSSGAATWTPLARGDGEFLFNTIYNGSGGIDRATADSMIDIIDVQCQ